MSYLSTCISYLLSSHLQFSFPSLISYLSTSYYHHLVLSLIFPPDINGQSLPHGDIHSSYCCLKHMVNLYCFETQQDFDVIFWNTTIWGCFVLKHNKMMVESTLETVWEMVVSSTWRIVLFVPRSSLCLGWFHSAIMWEKSVLCWRHNIAELACFEYWVLSRLVITTKSRIGCLIGVYFRDFVQLYFVAVNL